jgi:hypothetical protein
MDEWLNVPAGIDNLYGFVYLITNLKTGRKYLGKKFFWKIKKAPPLKGKKNKRLTRVESDWRNYWGSSAELLEDIKKLGTKYFKREILDYYATRWECAYYEAKYQFYYEVLLKRDYYNGIINCRLPKAPNSLIK